MKRKYESQDIVIYFFGKVSKLSVVLNNNRIINRQLRAYNNKEH